MPGSNNEMSPLSLFNEDCSLHIVMPGAADNIAFHVEFTLLLRSDLKSSRFPWLDWLVNIQCLHIKSMLYIRRGYLQGGWLALFEPDGIRFNGVLLHGDLDCDGLNGFGFTRLASGGETKYKKHQKTCKNRAH